MHPDSLWACTRLTTTRLLLSKLLQQAMTIFHPCGPEAARSALTALPQFSLGKSPPCFAHSADAAGWGLWESLTLFFPLPWMSFPDRELFLVEAWRKSNTLSPRCLATPFSTPVALRHRGDLSPSAGCGWSLGDPVSHLALLLRSRCADGEMESKSSAGQAPLIRVCVRDASAVWCGIR